MSILIFLLVLVTLVMIHEFGHYAAAKLCGMRVEEFAFGFPPKIWGKKIGETEYIVNLLPIGGYVKITGESFDEEERKKNAGDKKAFQNKSKLAQLFVLSAGVIMNLLLAAVLFTAVNMSARYVSADDNIYASYIKNPKVFVSSVAANSPAKTAGLTKNDEILEFKTTTNAADMKSASSVVDFVKKNNDADITIIFKKEKTGEVVTSVVRAVYGVTPDRKTVGMSVVYGEKVNLNPYDAFTKGVSETVEYTKLTVMGMIDIFSKLFSGENVLSSLSGPVGIAKMAGGASAAGWQTLLSFMAILSINLAVFNALPLPALDGGRFLFVIYEAISRRKISMNFQYYANLLGFLFLIGLMITVTFFDIFK